MNKHITRPKKTVNLRLSADLCDKITAMAKQDDRSFNYMVEKLLNKAIK